MEQTSLDLEEFAVALDQYPDLEEYDRAIIFSAVDLAPPDSERDAWDDETFEHYFDSPAYAAWKHAKITTLDTVTEKRWALTLDEAAGYVSAASKEDILAALYRGVRLIR